jgi:hypothetical protein
MLLSEVYGNRLEFKLNYKDFYYVSQTYLNESVKFYGKQKKVDDLVQNWRRFFNRFEIYDLFKINSHVYEYTASNYTNADKNETYFVHDHSCESFDYYTSRLETNQTENANLKCVFDTFFNIFNANWSNKNNPHSNTTYDQYKHAKLMCLNKTTNEERCVNDRFRESKFYLHLKSKRWCSAELANCIEFYKPCEVYVKNETFVKYYDLNVPYLTNAKDLNEDFVNDLEFQLKFDFNRYLMFFKQNYAESDAKLRLNLKQAKHFYQLLAFNLNMNDEVCLDFIENFPFIYVPNQVGLFESTSAKIFWHDSTNTFSKYNRLASPNSQIPVFLNEFYGDDDANRIDYKAMFVNQFKISEQPKYMDYIGLIEQMNKQNPNDDLLNDVFKIYNVFYDNFKFNENSNDCFRIDFLNSIKNKFIFLTYSNKWTKITENLVICDDHAVGQKFLDKFDFLQTNCSIDNKLESNCQFARINENLKPFFTDLCNFKYLSQVLTVKFEKFESPNLAPDHVDSLISRLLPYMQYYIHEKCKTKSIGFNFKNLKIYQAKSLKIMYICKHDPTARTCISQKTYFDFDLDGSISFYVSDVCTTNDEEIISGFLKVFKLEAKFEKGLFKFLLYLNEYLKTSEKPVDTQNIENYYDIKCSLPANVELWSLKPRKPQPQVKPKETTTSPTIVDMDRWKKLTFTKRNDNIDLIQKRPNELGVNCEQLFTTARNQQQLPNELSTIPNSHVNLFNLATFNRENNFIQVASLTDVKDITRDFAAPLQFSEVFLNQLKQNDDQKSKIGLWGEKFVYEALYKKYEVAIKQNNVKLEWLNRSNESGFPYDIKLVVYDEFNWGAIKEESYIEVKSTSKALVDADFFPISLNELQFAMQKPNDFSIYRVYSACSDNLNAVKIKQIKNVLKNLKEHNFKLMMII